MRHRTPLFIFALVLVALCGLFSTQPAQADLYVFPDTSGSATGAYTAIALSPSGNPVIAYQLHDSGATGDLMFVACTAPDCATFSAPVVLDASPVGLSAYYIDIAINPAGNPVIAYHDFTDTDPTSLKVVACTAPDCSTFNAPVVLDNTFISGFSPAIAINGRGFPVVAHNESTGSNAILKVIACTTATCSTFNPPVTVVNVAGEFNGRHLDMTTIGGNPVMVHGDSTNTDLEIVYCTAPDCSTFDAPITLDNNVTTFQTSGIGLNGSGFPVISYLDFTNNDLKFVACTAADCSTANAPIVLENTVNARDYTSLAVNSAGNPLITYWDNTNFAIRAIRCTSQDCSTRDTPFVIEDTAGTVGQFNKVIFNNLGHPVVSYYYASDTVFRGDLRVFTERPPRVTSHIPLDNATNVAVNTNIDIVFDEAVTVTPASFTLNCTSSGVVAFTLSGSGATYTLNPNTDLAVSEICTVTVIAANTTEASTLSVNFDQLDGNNDGVAGDNYVFDFTTSSSLTSIEFIAPTSTQTEADDVISNVMLTVPAGSITGIVTATLTFGGTATGGGIDYTEIATVTFDCTLGCDDVNSPYFADTLVIIQDTLIEGDETVTLTLSNPSSGVQLGTQVNHTLTITDDDAATIDFVLATDNIAENAGAHTAQARLNTTINGGAAGTATLAPGISISADITRADVGTVGADFSGATTASITFPAGSVGGATQPVTTPIFDDVLAEGNEDYTLTLSNITNTGTNVGVGLGTNAIQTVTIIDNDVPNVIITGAPVTAEGGATDTFTVVLTTDPGAMDVSITLTVTDSQTRIGLVGGPYGTTLTLTFNSGNYNTPQVVEVVAVDDAIVEGTHAGIVNATVSAGPANYVALNPLPSVNVVITDNDTTTTTTPPTTTPPTSGGANLELLGSVQSLPSTGETPVWRTPVLIGLALIVLMGFGVLLRKAIRH